MSTQDQADIRYTGEYLPANLGPDPSPETVKSLSRTYGWVKLCQITNNSSKTVEFVNPNQTTKGNIAPGETASYHTNGYIPLWSFSKRYEVKYYNNSMGAWKTIRIKDLDGNWWISFDHDGDDEDIRTIRPAWGATLAGFNLTINKSGYELYNVGKKEFNGRISFLTKK